MKITKRDVKNIGGVVVRAGYCEADYLTRAGEACGAACKVGSASGVYGWNFYRARLPENDLYSRERDCEPLGRRREIGRGKKMTKINICGVILSPVSGERLPRDFSKSVALLRRPYKYITTEEYAALYAAGGDIFADATGKKYTFGQCDGGRLALMPLNNSAALKTRAAYYLDKKEEARAAAIAYQEQAAERSQTYAEVEAAHYEAEKLARRFGLVREFRENGII